MAAVQLDHVETGLPRPSCCLGEFLHQTLNLAGRQRARRLIPRRERYRRRGYSFVSLDLATLSPQVHQLDAHSSPARVNQIGELPESRNTAIVVYAVLNRRSHAYVNYARRQYDERQAASGPGRVEILHGVVGCAVRGQPLDHGRHDDPVLQLQLTHFDRSEQTLESPLVRRLL